MNMTNHMPWNIWILVLTKALEHNSTNWIVWLHSKHIIDSCRINPEKARYFLGVVCSWVVLIDQYIKMMIQNGWRWRDKQQAAWNRWNPGGFKKSQQSFDGHIGVTFPRRLENPNHRSLLGSSCHRLAEFLFEPRWWHFFWDLFEPIDTVSSLYISRSISI